MISVRSTLLWVFLSSGLSWCWGCCGRGRQRTRRRVHREEYDCNRSTERAGDPAAATVRYATLWRLAGRVSYHHHFYVFLIFSRKVIVLKEQGPIISSSFAAGALLCTPVEDYRLIVSSWWAREMLPEYRIKVYSTVHTGQQGPTPWFFFWL